MSRYNMTTNVSGRSALAALKELTHDLHAHLDATPIALDIVREPSNREAYDAYLKAMLSMQRDIESWDVDKGLPFHELASFFAKALEQDITGELSTVSASHQKLNYFETLGAFYVLSGSMQGVSFLKKLLRSQIIHNGWPHTFLDDATSMNPMKALHQFRESVTRMTFASEDIDEMYHGASKVFASALKAFQQ